MAKWTKPRTWVTGETIVASILNTHLRDNLDHIRERDRVHAIHGSDRQLKTEEWELIRFDDEAFDNGDMHKGRKRNATIRFGHDGHYLVIFKIGFASNAVGDRRVQVRKNSDNNDTGGIGIGRFNEEAVGPSLQTFVAGQFIYRFNKGDHINLFARQDSGEPLNTNSGTASTSFLQVVQLGG